MGGGRSLRCARSCLQSHRRTDDRVAEKASDALRKWTRRAAAHRGARESRLDPGTHQRDEAMEMLGEAVTSRGLNGSAYCCYCRGGSLQVAEASATWRRAPGALSLSPPLGRWHPRQEHSCWCRRGSVNFREQRRDVSRSALTAPPFPHFLRVPAGLAIDITTLPCPMLDRGLPPPHGFPT
jgi:hypothetical protein